MAASVQCRQDRSLGMVMKEVDGDLAIFLEMRKREKEMDGLHRSHNFDGFDDSTDTMFTETLRRTPAAENFLNADSGKRDYDWLLTPPGTPSFPSSEMGVQNATSQIAASNTLTNAQVSEPENPPDESSSEKSISAPPTASTSKQSSALRNGKPLSSGGQKSTVSRSATPNARSVLPAASKSSRSSTPTSRGIAASSKPMAPPVRSSTPIRATECAPTPPVRSLIPATSKSTSRSATPTHKSSIPSSVSGISALSGRSSSTTKTVPTTSKNPGTSRGNFPTVKSRPKKTSEIPVFSPDAPPNLRMVVPKRPSSASRGKLNASSSLSSSSNATTGRPRQKLCSPSRGRGIDDAFNKGSTVLSRSRGYCNEGDDVNPVLIGTKMVERVVNMQKLPPPKHDNHECHDNSGKASLSQDNAGFGRSLSKKSLDMAIRHMDIRGSSGNLKTIKTSAPASSVFNL